MTTLTLQWVGGADDTPGAIGVDKLFINNSDATLEVSAVYTDAILAANGVTDDWLPMNGRTNAGGGFGFFVEKVKDSGGSDGIAPSSLIFVLDGVYAPVSFVANTAGVRFAAHVRYANSCSGWVAAGGAPGWSGSDATCGEAIVPAPEPSAALAFGVGALVVGSRLRRRRQPER